MDERADSSEYSINQFNGNIFNMVQPDLIPESDFANFISIIKEDHPIEKFCLDFECNHFTNTCTEVLQFPPMMSYGHNTEYVAVDRAVTDSNDGCYDQVMDPCLDMSTWNRKEEDVKVSEEFDDDDSSETVTNGNSDTRGRKKGGGAKGDRTRTLISERKRRSGMKEKLYALRSLVPNITKMDKASIVGDAARYIQDLQAQARNLRVEIATIEEASKNNKVISSQNSKKYRVSNSIAIVKKISKFDMFEVEEKGYYVRLVCNKGRGVAVSLHKALESITSFKVQSSNLSTVGDNFVLTFNLNVTVCEFDINLPNLKLWLSGAFLNQGFEFNMFP
uniref:transcription factor FER-LIKE IRON DEFICIENCY-INDUCED TRANSCRIPTION FACTOR-like n=1 Tax=Erigeron canadensis TaxID=72917 RepID=UPI001CB8FAD6|nr:transcription factor FER-LIKE IRON DEFICIENCY-INDUCED TRANSCRIPTION FACTOR-like [Erigeron canadensis]